MNYNLILKNKQQKLINNIFTHEDTKGHIIYMISAMCQTSLPINKPNNNIRFYLCCLWGICRT